MFPIIKQFIAKNLQKTLNHYVALDPETKTTLTALNGKVINIELQNVAITLQLIFNQTQLELQFNNFLKPDATIKGTPLSLLHLSSVAADKRKRFFAEDVEVSGDLELAEQVINLFDHLDIDWEEYLSHWIGDIPSHSVGRFARKLTTLSKNLKDTLLQNINEYTHEEIKIFPPKEALHDFFQDVDMLRMDTDRLEARFEQLLQPHDLKKEM